MLTSFELENFKAFGTSTRIDFAPITLIFGENSAGKSSILHSLSLLKQTRESREHGALLLPRAEGGLVDLGSFQELLFDHDTSRSLRFRFDMQIAHGGRLSQAFPLVDKCTLGYEFAFSPMEEDNEVTLQFLKVYLQIAAQDERIATYEPRQLEPEEERFHRPPYNMWRTPRPGLGYKRRVAECTAITSLPVFWRQMYESWKEDGEQVLTAIRMLRDNVHGKRLSNHRSLFAEDNEAREAFAEADTFYRSDYSLHSFLARARRAERGALVTLDGFIPLPTASERSARYPEFEAVRQFSAFEGPSDLISVDVGMLLAEAGRELEEVLWSLFPMGPYRQPPKRLYIFTGTTPNDVGYSGNLLPDLLFRRPELVAEANQWLDRLEIGYHIVIKAVGTHSNDLFELRLVDTRRKAGVDVALSDVGFGISQLLPFVVQSLAAERQIITIEQPEVHVHPRLQADLGDLLIAAIQEPRSHRFIVETHSEHLILRLLRRIRETEEKELPAGHPGLRPSDISVIYLERGEDGTVAHRLRVDDTGEFVDKWPRGFFEERAREVF